MVASRATAILLIACLLAPVAQAGELGGRISWLPDWVVDLFEKLRDSLSQEFPTNTSQNIGPEMVPTG